MSFINASVESAKRTLDTLVAGAALCALAPLLLLVGVLVRLDSKGPALFRQLRIGAARQDRTELFEMIKFRTMVEDAESGTGAVWAQQRDPRVTRLGRVLRKTRLDELPQLINVLRGEMSLIGPRPERPGFYQRLESQIPFFAERTYGLRPGITGLAQVNQGYDACIDDVRRKVGFDHAYALALTSPASSLRTDLNITLRTVLVMVFGRGQ